MLWGFANALVGAVGAADAVAATAGSADAAAITRFKKQFESLAIIRAIETVNLPRGGCTFSCANRDFYLHVARNTSVHRYGRTVHSMPKHPGNVIETTPP